MYVFCGAELGGLRLMQIPSQQRLRVRRPITLWTNEASQQQKHSPTEAESKLNATSARLLSASFIREHLSLYRSGSD